MRLIGPTLLLGNTLASSACTPPVGAEIRDDNAPTMVLRNTGETPVILLNQPDFGGIEVANTGNMARTTPPLTLTDPILTAPLLPAPEDPVAELDLSVCDNAYTTVCQNLPTDCIPTDCLTFPPSVYGLWSEPPIIQVIVPETPATASSAENPGDIVDQISKLPWKDLKSWLSVILAGLGVFTINRFLIPRLQKQLEDKFPQPREADDNNANSIAKWISTGMSAAKQAVMVGGVLVAAGALGIDLSSFYNIIMAVGAALVITNKDVISNLFAAPIVRATLPHIIKRDIEVDGRRFFPERIRGQFVVGTAIDKFGDEGLLDVPATRLLASSIFSKPKKPESELLNDVIPGKFLTLKSADGTICGRIKAKTQHIVIVESKDSNGLPVLDFAYLSDLNPHTARISDVPPRLAMLGMEIGDTIRVAFVGDTYTTGELIAWDESLVWIKIENSAVMIVLQSTLVAKMPAIVAKHSGVAPTQALPPNAVKLA